MAWRIVISSPAGFTGIPPDALCPIPSGDFIWSVSAPPFAGAAKKEEPASAASVLVRNFLLEDIGNNLTPIKIAHILIHRAIKYIAYITKADFKYPFQIS
jgi:hypothetical protein